MTDSLSRPSPIENPPVSGEDIAFSHPSEKEFAKVLDFYGIEWLYEPTTFPLQWDEQGNILEAFSPDFYLVQQDVYIELTTLRLRLMRVKHRKFRLLRELYPEVNARLWNRNDFEFFLEHLGLADHGGELIGKEALEQGNNA